MSQKAQDGKVCKQSSNSSVNARYLQRTFTTLVRLCCVVVLPHLQPRPRLRRGQETSSKNKERRGPGTKRERSPWYEGQRTTQGITSVQEKRHIPQEMTMLQPKGFSSTARAIHADIPVWVRFGRSLIARNDTRETVKPTQTKIGASSAGPFARRSITINRVLRNIIAPAKLCWPEH